MDIYELRSFTVLAEHLHFERAARALNLSQPALTKRIRKMEAAVGGALFERGSRGTRLTSFGESWLMQARELVAHYDQLIAQGRKGAAGKAGRLRVGFGFATLDLVPRVVAKLREAAPELQIALRDMSTAEQLSALQERRLDVGFLRLPLSPGRKELEVLPVVEDRLALVAPGGASRSGGLRLADCRGRPFIAISKDRSPGFHAHMIKLCDQHGFHPRIVQDATEFATVLSLVRAGMGLALLPESFWNDRYRGVEMHRIPHEGARWSVGAAWRRRDENPALREFLRVLRQEI